MRSADAISASPSVAAELVEEGFLAVRRRPDGELEYHLTRQGIEEVEELLANSPSAREYLARMKENAPDRERRAQGLPPDGSAVSP